VVLETTALEGLPEVTHADARGGAYRLTTGAPHRTIPELFPLLRDAGGELTGLRTHHATLDDVFLAHTGRQLRDE
jgi:ABC-2 type transport system ATP-binding protein